MGLLFVFVGMLGHFVRGENFVSTINCFKFAGDIFMGIFSHIII